jgi:hypothetical protein
VPSLLGSFSKLFISLNIPVFSSEWKSGTGFSLYSKAIL